MLFNTLRSQKEEKPFINIVHLLSLFTQVLNLGIKNIGTCTLLRCLHFLQLYTSTPLHLRGTYRSFHSATFVYQLNVT